MNRLGLNFLSLPGFYHYARHLALGGLPFREWVKLYGLDEPSQRIADLGCGPADILRYLNKNQLPEHYVGIDFDQKYLNAATAVSRRLGIAAEFVRMDLAGLSSSDQERNMLAKILEKYRISRVLLLGVLHHIDDSAIQATMRLLHKIPSVQSVVTQDVVFVDRMKLNNWLASHDRGEHVRTESQYKKILEYSGWSNIKVDWTRPGLPGVRYIHFTMSR